MTDYPAKTFDVYDVERAVVKTRNRLLTLLESKGDRDAKKVFVIGHARTGTTSFHNAFQAANIKSRHGAGNWHLATHDAFSDRGDYRPLDLYRAYFPNATFILNTRPLGPWLRSTLWQKGRSLSERNLINIIHRRNRYFANVINEFKGDERLLVVDITRPGAVEFAMRTAGLPYEQEIKRANATPKSAKVPSLDALDAVARGPLGALFDRPFIIPELLDPSDHPYDGWQKAVPNNLAA